MVAKVSDSDLQARVREIAETVAGSRGVDLVELICVRAGRRQIVRLLVDRVGGVTIDECADVSRRLAAGLDVTDIMDGRYTLEVSSPGTDRPLKTAADFRRKEGKRVCLQFTGDDEQTRSIEGVIGSVDESSVAVGDQRVPLDRIKEGKLVVAIDNR